MFKISEVDNDGNTLISKVGNLTNKCPECDFSVFLTAITKTKNNEVIINYKCESGLHSGFTSLKNWEKGFLQNTDIFKSLENYDMEESYFYCQKTISKIFMNIETIKTNTYINDEHSKLIYDIQSLLLKLDEKFNL
jgi:hypothetical protein